MYNSAYGNAGFCIALHIFSLLCIATPCARAVPLQSFYPDSPDDISLGRNDDGVSAAITLSTAFPFFGTSQTTAFVRSYAIKSCIRRACAARVTVVVLCVYV